MVYILILNVMLLGGKAFVRCLSHSAALMIGIGALIKEIPHSSQPLPPCQIEREVCDLEEGPHLTVLAPSPWTLASKTDKYISVVYKLVSSCYFCCGSLNGLRYPFFCWFLNKVKHKIELNMEIAHFSNGGQVGRDS